VRNWPTTVIDMTFRIRYCVRWKHRSRDSSSNFSFSKVLALNSFTKKLITVLGSTAHSLSQIKALQMRSASLTKTRLSADGKLRLMMTVQCRRKYYFITFAVDPAVSRFFLSSAAITFCQLPRQCNFSSVSSPHEFMRIFLCDRHPRRSEIRSASRTPTIANRTVS
jgi:hypothetical protein